MNETLVTLDKCSIDALVAETKEAREHYKMDIAKKEGKMGEKVDHEYASKGVAGSGLGLGIAGTALGLLGANGGAGLGGLLGGGNNTAQQLSDAKAELAQIKAERYTDQSILTERDRHLEWVKQLAAQDARLDAQDEALEKLATKNASDIAALKENIALQNQIDNLKAEKDMLVLKNELQGQISQVAQSSALGIQTNAGSIACLQNTVNSLVQTVIPSRNVCNTGCNCNCCNVQQ